MYSNKLIRVLIAMVSIFLLVFCSISAFAEQAVKWEGGIDKPQNELFRCSITHSLKPK
jgi:hypothetical protein